MKHTFKSLNINHCQLNNSQIDIWQFALHTEFSEAQTILTPQEIARANRFYFAHHRRRFIIARATMRLILARYLDIIPHQLTFKENTYGKPELPDLSAIQFNISHSGDLALLAVGCTTPLGIDLEFFSGRPYTGIANNMFSITENQSLNNITPSLKPLTFFHIWSQKEALIKACGLGLSYPTQSFDVPIQHSSNSIVKDTLHNIDWMMQSFMPAIGCSAALCYHPAIKNIYYHTIENIEHLV